jgi:hypothetical protein
MSGWALLACLKREMDHFQAISEKSETLILPCFADLIWPGDDMDPIALNKDPGVHFKTKTRVFVLIRVGNTIRYYAGVADPFNPNPAFEIGEFPTIAAALNFGNDYLVSEIPLAEIKAERRIRASSTQAWTD